MKLILRFAIYVACVLLLIFILSLLKIELSLLESIEIIALYEFYRYLFKILITNYLNEN